MSTETLVLKLMGEVSEKIGALQRDVERMAEQGESINAQHTFLLEQQGKLLEELGKQAREIVDIRERVTKIESEPPAAFHPMRERAPSITTETREKQTESMRVAAEAMKSTAAATKYTPWLTAFAAAAAIFFATLANNCTMAQRFVPSPAPAPALTAPPKDH